MSVLAHFSRRLGNRLYETAFPIYRPLYRAFKAVEDRDERRLLARRLQKGDVAVDVGANIGVYSQFLARCVGARGAVHSFEPSPDNFERLQAGLASSSNVQVNQLAVSDKSEETTLYISNDLNVDHRVYPTSGMPRQTVTIRSTTLDDYFRPGERVNLIKMDVQGYELHALRGAERVLADNPSLKLLLEYWPHGLQQAGASAAELLHFLYDHRLTAFRLFGNDLVQYTSKAGDPVGPDHYLNLFIERINHDT
ncbi:MAG: FkbM family methyltransferase [Chthoniobacterales bacterium]|nr:FkbM family methyltransferase [Chthoniobacterales bacterium]